MRGLVRLGGVLLACAVFQVLLVLAPDRTPVVLIGGLLTTMLAIVAALRHAELAHRSSGRARAAWIFTAAATGLWAAGSACYTLDVSAGLDAPPPRLGDWFAFFAVVLAPGVLIAGPSAPVSWGSRVRLVLDGLMVAAALFVPAWPLLLQPIHRLVGSTGGLLAAGIPALHIVCLSIAIVLLSRSPTRTVNAVTALAGAFAGFAISVLIYLYVALNGGSWQVHSLTGIFAATTILLLYAGSFGMPVNDRPWLEVPQGFRAALPYLPVAGAFVAGAMRQRAGRLDDVTLTALVVVGGALLARQFLALRSNARLLAEVEDQRRQLAHQATHDDLTGLANRKLLRERAASAPGAVALLLIDLDGFKQVNDQRGHAAGDAVLIRVAELLRSASPDGATVARLGGDEFAILLAPVSGAEQAMEIAGLIIDLVAAMDDGVGASVGVAYEPGGADLETLLGDADAALHRAEAAGKGTAVRHLERV